jgi:hypothetical protein
MPELSIFASAMLVRYPVRLFRVGGLRFLRVGRIQLSFCICRR